ncbi:hypothetical protein PI124_g12275 [Phytophthora idaei]|nr:hypothetical protein PI125_g11737 [Phytophthora idaei]KAG3242880.1 hypothetical protein PI124_g12275 [Phytophthora idaei]
MNSFIQDRDGETTLEEALAIIDSFNLVDTISNSPSHSPPTESHEREDVRNPTVTRKKKRKRSNLSSSVRLQQRKKAEILYLRRLIQEMEEVIEQLKTKRLQNTSHMRSECSKEGGKDWVLMAKRSHQARLKSEKTNCALKAIMATQVQVSDSLREIMQMQVSFQEDDIFLDTEALP